MATRSLQSEVTHLRNLVQAGWDGALSAAKGTDSRALTRIRPRTLLAPAALGAGIGALGVSFGKNRRPGYRSTIAGFIGSVVGLGAGVAWSSRGLVGPATRGALRKITRVRDAHWLERNPIDYA